MMNVQTSAQRKVNVRRMAVISVLSAISIVLSMIPFVGYIKLGPVDATIMHVPVIIGAVVEGPLVGAAVGLIFGLTSLFKAFTEPSITSFCFMNPIISVLPRILIGVVSYYVYKLIYKISKRVYLSGFVAGVLGSLTNTIGVMGLIYVIYADKYMQAIGQAGNAGKYILLICATNGIPEAIVAGILVAAVAVVMIRKSKK
ncbi:MAG: ECF transporter S component [Intestinibacter sp.]|uniref:ECF transporter S component n=1 Tax=Intestinibacter sp. TaxID=1965304 RepID=UPI0025BA323A|nr:ECF transporter S component [Intestinibacter sp.]MCI6736768.1 ECF transporter S component [Intestinibacter sp.]